jgi:hypothetical protein
MSHVTSLLVQTVLMLVRESRIKASLSLNTHNFLTKRSYYTIFKLN